MLLRLAVLGTLGYLGYRQLQKTQGTQSTGGTQAGGRSPQLALAGGPLSANATVQSDPSVPPAGTSSPAVAPT